MSHIRSIWLPIHYYFPSALLGAQKLNRCIIIRKLLCTPSIYTLTFRLEIWLFPQSYSCTESVCLCPHNCWHYFNTDGLGLCYCHLLLVLLFFFFFYLIYYYSIDTEEANLISLYNDMIFHKCLVAYIKEQMLDFGEFLTFLFCPSFCWKLWKCGEETSDFFQLAQV